MNGSSLGQCSPEGGDGWCLVKATQGTASVSAWKNKHVECVFAFATVLPAPAKISGVCCTVDPHLATAQLHLSHCNSHITFGVSSYADVVMSDGLR